MSDCSGHYKWVEISGRALIASLTTGNAYHIVDGLPSGANVVGRGYDPERDEFYLLIEHENFNYIPEGEDIPNAEIEVKDLDLQDMDY